MASELHVDAIKHSGGTSALTIDSSGNVHKAGMVVQVQTGTLGHLSTSSATMGSIGSLSITPKFSSSKILIIVQNHVYVYQYATDDWRSGLVQIKRDSTSLETEAGEYGEGSIFEGNSEQFMTYSTRVLFDSPSSTSALSYEVLGASRGGNTTVQFNNASYGVGGRIILQEIKQ